jgi:hypothetical protein
LIIWHQTYGKEKNYLHSNEKQKKNAHLFKRILWCWLYSFLAKDNVYSRKKNHVLFIPQTRPWQLHLFFVIFEIFTEQLLRVPSSFRLENFKKIDFLFTRSSNRSDIAVSMGVWMSSIRVATSSDFCGKFPLFPALFPLFRFFPLFRILCFSV